MSENGNRVYELGYLLVPNMTETDVPAFVETMKAAVTSLEGTIVSEGTPEFIDLAYVIERSIASKKTKYAQAYFGWMKFEVAPEAQAPLKKALDSMTDVVRYILIKTSVENTIVFKKPKVEPKRDVFMSEEMLVEEEAGEEAEEAPVEVHETLPSVEADLVADNATEE